MFKNFFILLIVLALFVSGLYYFTQTRPAMAPTGWKLATSTAGATFNYPADLGTAYIHVLDWPPQLTFTSGPFTCLSAGEPAARAGKTEERLINNQRYCVTVESEGAAGSTYTQYAYAFPANDQVATLIFSLKSVQCGNYDDPKKSECAKERANFQLDPVIDQMVQTLDFSQIKK